jgi:hypothetical protein
MVTYREDLGIEQKCAQALGQRHEVSWTCEPTSAAQRVSFWSRGFSELRRVTTERYFKKASATLQGTRSEVRLYSPSRRMADRMPGDERFGQRVL